MSEKARRRKFLRWDLGSLEYGVGLGRAFAMRADEEMRDDRDRLVREQFGSVPPHLDMAIRAGRCFEMLGGASETINHGARLRFRKP